MKKDFIFAPVMLLIGVALFLLKFTGMPLHIAVSVIGVLILAVYTVATKKDWKLPVFEVIMRICYGIALISGIVIMNVEGIVTLAIVHRVFAILFVVMLVILFIQKAITFNKSK